MYRPLLAPSLTNHPTRCQESWARIFAALTLWICVSVILRYGFYGNSRVLLGPSSSRLVQASSVFVKHVEVRGDDRKEVSLYGFLEKPKLDTELNWSVSDYMIVGSYGRKGFSLWLNKGSKMSMRWEAQTSSLSYLKVDLIKGDRNYQTLLPSRTNSSYVRILDGPTYGKEADYFIEEDDRYYVDITNSNPKSIIMTMIINVSSKMHDITGAKSKCSTSFGSCRIKLMFPYTQYVIVSTPDNGDLGGWSVELSFVARMPTYFVVLGFLVIMLFLILKYLGACEGEQVTNNTSVSEITETDPIVPHKFEEDKDSGESSSSSSSEELYDGKICVICYDEQRNCFFIPCGHCATCYDCAERIMVGEKKVCPICRRLVHKLKKLYNP